MSGPVRIQLRRTKGWRMPENTVVVSRPGTLGNPFTIPRAIESGYTDAAGAQAFVVECFQSWLGPAQQGRDWWQGPESDKRKAGIIAALPSLRGKNLGCWCRLCERHAAGKPLDEDCPDCDPCHVDPLGRMANHG